MRGHTADRMIGVTLASVILRARREIARRQDQEDEVEYFRGRVDAAEELAILLDVQGHMQATLARAAEPAEGTALPPGAASG